MLSPFVTTTEVGVWDSDTTLVIGGGKTGRPGSEAKAGTAGPAATASGTAARSIGSSILRAIRTIAPLPTSEPSQTRARPKTCVASPAIAASRRTEAVASSGGTDVSQLPKLDQSGRSHSGSNARRATNRDSKAVTRVTMAATYGPDGWLRTSQREIRCVAGTMPVAAKGEHVKVRIGIADSTKVVELETDDPAEFEQSFNAALGGEDTMVWVDDAKNRRVGIPREKVAYVEIETEDGKQSVGFGPS